MNLINFLSTWLFGVSCVFYQQNIIKMELRHHYTHSDKVTDHWLHWVRWWLWKLFWTTQRTIFTFTILLGFSKQLFKKTHPLCSTLTEHPFWNMVNTVEILLYLWSSLNWAEKNDEGRKAIDTVPIKRLRLLLLSYIWLDLKKSGFHTCNSKTHFLLSNNSCTN